jgi:hypothetical protein
MKTCKQCQSDFSITESDLAFYKQIEVPAPSLCPPCRAQRRLTWRNERKLYLNKSALSGKQVVSVISPDKDMQIYESDEWWSDAYNPLNYGREMDFSRSFFDQFSDLLKAVPHMNLIGSNNENCGYCHLLANCQNCYMIVESSNNEDCYYSYWLQKCVGSCDSSYSHECQYVYEVDNCYNCYNLKWSTDCSGSFDSAFLQNCKGVKNSFGCVNLRQKEYCIYNEQKTKEEYELFISQIDFESHKTVELLKAQFKEFALRYPNKFAHINNSENCTGDFITDSKDCEECYHAHDADSCKYSEHVWRNAHNIMDTSTAGRDAELIYESINTGISVNNIQFAVQNWTCSDMQYCYGSFNSNNNFGCVGLKRNEYCILNKQYSKEDYFILKAKIIEHMKSTEEWGEFFPAKLSPFGYNETVAQEHYPLTRDLALSKGFSWSDFEAPNPKVEKTIRPNTLPDANKEISDEIVNWAIECEVSGRLFRIIKEELGFYRKYKIPIPRKHPDVRHLERIKERHTNLLWDRTCAKCNDSMKSSYSPQTPEIVYCEKCFLKEVY